MIGEAKNPSQVPGSGAFASASSAAKASVHAARPVARSGPTSFQVPKRLSHPTQHPADPLIEHLVEVDTGPVAQRERAGFARQPNQRRAALNEPLLQLLDFIGKGGGPVLGLRGDDGQRGPAHPL